MDIDYLKYTPIIQMIATKFPKHYKDDLIQEGYLSLVDAQRNYDSEKGEFEVYAKKWIYYAMLRFISIDSSTNSLDVTITDDQGEQTTFKDLLEDPTDYEDLITNQDYLEKHMLTRSQKERFIIRKYFIDNLTVQQIIDLFSQWHGYTNPKSIYKILKLNK